MSTAWISVAASGLPASAPRATNWAAIRWASRSTAGGQSGTSGAWPARTSATREHRRGQWGRGDVEVASEVEEGALAHGVAEAFGLHEAVGEVGGRRRRFVGSGCAVRTCSQDSGRPGTNQAVHDDYGTTFRVSRPRSFRINKLPSPTGADPADFDRNVGDLGKLGLGMTTQRAYVHRLPM